MEKLTKKRFKEAVLIWVEMKHFDVELGELSEDSDEVGELYEFENWFENPQEEEDSIMGLHYAIEQAESIANRLQEVAESKLQKYILDIASSKSGVKFFGKDVTNIDESNIESVFDYLSDCFDDIYTYNAEEQLKRFIEQLLLADEKHMADNQ